jgi:Family of unknown function (DUF6166)
VSDDPRTQERGMQKLYVGRRDKNHNCTVRVIEDGDSRLLNPRLDLFNHSPTGFEWGYGGSGPAQLALALLADALEADDTAVRFHQQLKRMLVARMPHDAWSITNNTICRYAVVIAIGEKAYEQH